MKYIVAVSGGVDSVVLLDILAKRETELIVAHVNHGIRSDADDDERFVAGLAAKYGLKFVSTQLHLGAKASEETARDGRYEFLFAQAKKHQATIATAHHADDLVGTVAINLHRGTGWRGLAVLNRSGIERPLLAMRKREIYDYALAHHLEWVEDSTNSDMRILRNRLRGAIYRLDGGVIKKLDELHTQQIELVHHIDDEITQLNQTFSTARYPYSVLDASTAAELVRLVIEQVTSVRPTRQEAARIVLAIKTAKPGKILQLEGGANVRFSTREFVVQSHLK